MIAYRGDGSPMNGHSKLMFADLSIGPGKLILVGYMGIPKVYNFIYIP